MEGYIGITLTEPNVQTLSMGDLMVFGDSTEHKEPEHKKSSANAQKRSAITAFI